MDDRRTHALRATLPKFSIAGVCVLLITLAIWMMVSQPRGGTGPDAEAAAQAAFEEATGIRIVRVAITAGGGMIDLRYQALNPDKALVAHDRKRPPLVIDEATGQSVSRPWMDHSRARSMQTGVVYYTLLLNKGGVIRRDSSVTVGIGDARLKHVIVQ